MLAEGRRSRFVTVNTVGPALMRLGTNSTSATSCRASRRAN